MKTLKITQLRQNLLGIFEDCQNEDFLITRWGKPWIVLIGHPHALNLHLREDKSDFPKGIPVFAVIILGNGGDDQE